MSEDPKKNENKNQFDKVKDRLTKKPQLPKNSFNIYWIYAVILAILIGLEFFSPFSNEGKEITTGRFLVEMLKKGHVKKIVVVNGDLAEIFIKKDSLGL